MSVQSLSSGIPFFALASVTLPSAYTLVALSGLIAFYALLFPAALPFSFSCVPALTMLKLLEIGRMGPIVVCALGACLIALRGRQAITRGAKSVVMFPAE